MAVYASTRIKIPKREEKRKEHMKWGLLRNQEEHEEKKNYLNKIDKSVTNNKKITLQLSTVYDFACLMW